jgi:ATP-dependent DNA ligase
MTARSVRDIPTAGHWSYEPKADGFRALVFRDQTGRVRLQSRQQRSLTRYFPDVVAAIAEQLVGDVVLDGEIVVYHHGRLDFAALQRRFSGGGTRQVFEAPACYLVFDVLHLAGRDLLRQPYRHRRAQLVDLLGDAPLPLAVVPMTTDPEAAQAWLTEHTDAGIEGVVAKRTDHAYLPHRHVW